jgi:pimeloyl-ACP methyl ester carboxylesterase
MVREPRSVNAHLCLTLAGAATCLSCASCTDLLLAKYRDPDYLENHRYRLGEQYISVGGLELCYQEQGWGEPLIILPGLATSVDFWQLNVPVLARSYHVLALDLPGFGKSAKPDVPYDLDWFCDQILLFMDAKGIHRASFIGDSMGGQLAMMIAHRHRERVDKLVLTGSCGAWPPPSRLVTAALNALWNESIVTDHLRRTWPSTFTGLFRRQTEVTRDLLRYQMAIRAEGSGYAPEGRASARAMRSIFFHSCRSCLGDLSQPTLLIWGQHDHIHLFSEAATLRMGIPDSRLVVVPDAAHAVMIDQPETFNRLILAFLKDGTRAICDDFGGHRLPGVPARPADPNSQALSMPPPTSSAASGR